MAPVGDYLLFERPADGGIGIASRLSGLFGAAQGPKPVRAEGELPDDACRPQATLTEVPTQVRKLDAAAFSPKGSAAIVYSSAENRYQILTGLPDNPEAMAVVEANQPAREIEQAILAVTDDGQVGAFVEATGDVVVFGTRVSSRAIYHLSGRGAARFLAGSHDLLVCDSKGGEIVRIINAASSGARQLLVGQSQGLSPEFLGVSSDGTFLITGSSANKRVWAIELNSGTVSSWESPVAPSMIRTTRSAGTFLLRADEGEPAWLMTWSGPSGPVFTLAPQSPAGRSGM